jgi:hypothetical protein
MVKQKIDIPSLMLDYHADIIAASNPHTGLETWGKSGFVTHIGLPAVAKAAYLTL